MFVDHHIIPHPNAIRCVGIVQAGCEGLVESLEHMCVDPLKDTLTCVARDKFWQEVSVVMKTKYVPPVLMISVQHWTRCMV